MLIYNETTELWHFYHYHLKFKGTVITISSKQKTLLLGRHKASFVLAKDEKCYKDKDIQTVKLSVCREDYISLMMMDSVFQFIRYVTKLLTAGTNQMKLIVS